jgi:hypothetical protein
VRRDRGAVVPDDEAAIFLAKEKKVEYKPAS